MIPQSTPCPPEAHCLPSTCDWRCAISVIDELLGQEGAVSGEETDLLLELRWHLRERNGAEATLRLFCDLRRRLEQRHYLAFFRMRRWLENNILSVVTLETATEPAFIPLRLNHYCVEAVRRVSLCCALETGGTLVAPRVIFMFRAATPAARPAEPATRDRS